MVIPDSSDDDGSDKTAEMQFSALVDSNTTSVDFDISSALQALAARYAYKAVPPTRYPYIKFRCVASDDWMVDGRIYENIDEVKWPGSGTAPSANLLTGLDTGAGWTDSGGQQADFRGAGTFYVLDDLFSPTITLEEDYEYVFSYDCDDESDAYLYDVDSGNMIDLDYTVSGDTISANIVGEGRRVKVGMRIRQEGTCSNLSLIRTGGQTIYTFYAYAFMGSWTDMERMKASVDGQGVEYLNTSVMSRKPTSSPEVVFASNEFIYPAEFNRSILDIDHMSDDATPVFVSGAPTDGPKSLSYIPIGEGAITVGGHTLYAINSPTGNGYLLRFINGMGCMESLHVTSMVKREVPITTDKHTVAKQETLKKFSRSVVRKSNDRETWYLTSGALDDKWASWYVHEFLMSEQLWIKLGTLWIPCHVVPEETTVLEDRTKAQPYEVQFKLEMDINGSPI